jgi:hypothetical protein
MDLSDGREAYLAADSWVRQLDASDSPTDEPSVTVRLVSENLKCLKVVLKHVSPPDFEMPVTTRKSLQECYSRLILWVDGYGVEQGELDEAMARSRRLRRAVTEILVSIGRTVLDGKLPLNETANYGCRLLTRNLPRTGQSPMHCRGKD